MRFVRVFSITAIVALLISSVEPQGDMKCPSIKANNNEKKAKKFIVTFKKGSKDAAKEHLEMMKECYGRPVEHITTLGKKASIKTDKKTIRNFSVEGFMQGYNAYFTPSFANEIKKMKNVARVEEDKPVKILYAIPQINKREVDDNPTENIDRIDQAKRPPDGTYEFPDEAGEGVNIFIVDTGIRTTHNEFEDRAKFGGSFCEGCNEDDENGHGTHVASIAAGKTLGVARKSNLIAVRVLDADGAGSNAGVIEGLSFVADQHRNAKNKNSVVNMSLGGGFSQAVNDGVKALTDDGIHVVVAAGNDGEDACGASPASEPSAITVGATEADNDDVTDFSNIGKCVDVFAPGRDIQGAGINNDNDNAVFSGTSQACPHVAGTVALMISKDGNKSPKEMAKELDKLATKGVIPNLSNGSPDRFLRIPSP